MGKARKIGAHTQHIPNSKMDLKFNRKLFERRQQIHDEATLRSERRREEKEWKELERMKREAYSQR